MNEENHWNSIAPSYDDEIFDVFASDRRKLLPGYFWKYARKDQIAIDFGCGTGKALHFLSPSFGEVIAVDISEKLLSIARRRNFSNVTFKRLDLAKPFKLRPAHFAFCCNVVMLPEIERNLAMLRNIRRSLNAGGTALLVLPSLDSFFYAAWRLVEWCEREGLKPEKIQKSEFDGFRGSKVDLIRGVVQINGVKTKHYSRPELDVVLGKAGFSAWEVERLEYEWDTEFTKPPKWMKEPYPWDWVIACKA